MKALFLIFLLSLPGMVTAQHSVSGSVRRVDIRIPYNHGDGRVPDCGSIILRELARDVLREPEHVLVRVSFDLSTFISAEGGRYTMRISLLNPDVSGDTLYRSFPVTGVLFPSHISMKLRWANLADTSGYTEEQTGMKPISPADTMICTMPVASFNSSVDTLIIREISLTYDSAALRRFMERLELIRDYYASGLLLDSLEQLTANIDFENPGELPYNYLRVEELGIALMRIHARDFPETLLRNGFDPIRLMQKYQQLYRRSKTLVYNFIDEIRHTGAIPGNGDADSLAAYFTSRALSYVRRSFLMDQWQGRIYGDCLDHFFDKSTFPPEENVMEAILRKMFPGARVDTMESYMSKAICDAYHRTAGDLMRSDRYAEAFSLLENERRFVSASKALNGLTTDEKMLSEAAQGIYDSYTGIASTCIGNGKYAMADTYLARAEEYAVAHSRYIRSDSAYHAVFSELFFLRNTECDRLLDMKKYDEALECYNHFGDIYSAAELRRLGTKLDEKISLAARGVAEQYMMLAGNALKHKESDTALYLYEKAETVRKIPGVILPGETDSDSLAPAMAQIRYGQLVREGAGALDKLRYTLAVNHLKEAASLSGKFRLKADPAFDSLWHRSMKFYLITRLSSSQKNIWDNRFDSAEATLLRTEMAVSEHGLQNDPDLVSAIRGYNQKIIEQRCRNLRDSIDLRLIRAGRSIALRNFMNATANLEEAVSLCRSVPGCDLAEGPLRDTLARYRPVADYQKKMEDVRSLVTTGNYREAVKELFSAQQAFQNQQLDRFALQTEGMYKVIRERQNPYFTEKAIDFFTDRGEYPEALSYLVLANEQGLPVQNTSGVQQRLGKELATSDHRKDPAADPLENLAGIIPAGKWFDGLRRSYLNEWRSMNRK